MNNPFTHLIAKHGVLTSFSIAKKITKEEIAKLSAKIKKKCKSPGDFQKLLNTEIINSTRKSIEKEIIPGVIGPKKASNSNESVFNTTPQKILKLNFFGNAVSKKIIDEKLSKDEICYIILTMLSILGIHDTDFADFHNKNRLNMGGVSGDDGDDDEDPDDDDADGPQT
jgi:hypothetical protein